MQERYWKLDIKLHRDVGKSSCPWKFFDITAYNLWEYKPRTEQIFSLSRYYSPVQWQSKYYQWKTYEADVTMNCGADAIWNNWCLYPANWRILTNEMRWKVVACPKEYPLGTKFYFEWIWEVTCVDRWWAIVWNRLDMRCWIWEEALDNWNTCPTGQRLGRIVK